MRRLLLFASYDLGPLFLAAHTSIARSLVFSLRYPDYQSRHTKRWREGNLMMMAEARKVLSFFLFPVQSILPSEGLNGNVSGGGKGLTCGLFGKKSLERGELKIAPQKTGPP